MAQSPRIAPKKWRDSMSKKNIITKEIVEILSRFPAGASIEEIMLAFIPMPRRTLQRWLSKLIAEDLVILLGSARSRRYRLKPQTINSLTKTHSSLILSTESEKIHNFVTNPIASRHPVSYNRSWLESYQPNITEYLPKQVRDVFIWAYQRSCARYSTIHHSLAEPDPFRLRYRT